MHPFTVRDVVTYAAARLGGMQRLVKAAQSGDRSVSPSDYSTLLAIAEGRVVPPWPIVERIAQVGKLKLSAVVERDWGLRFAENLVAVSPRLAGDIRSRALRTVIAARYPSVKHAIEELLPELPVRRVTRVLRLLGMGHAHNPSVVETVPCLLHAFSPSLSVGEREFLSVLFQQDGDLRETLRQMSMNLKPDELSWVAIGATQAELYAHLDQLRGEGMSYS